MGAAKNKKISGDVISKKYLEDIALDAFENGEITSLPESDKDLYESLKNLFEQKHRNIVDYLKWYRSEHIEKNKEILSNNQISKYYDSLPEVNSFNGFEKYKDVVKKEITKIFNTEAFQNALLTHLSQPNFKIDK
jgi:hypothetical protein